MYAPEKQSNRVNTGGCESLNAPRRQGAAKVSCRSFHEQPALLFHKWVEWRHEPAPDPSREPLWEVQAERVRLAGEHNEPAACLTASIVYTSSSIVRDIPAMACRSSMIRRSTVRICW